MDLLTQLNNAVDYIEENIWDEIALADVSSVTAYSPYHFGRLFYYIAEMPLSEYIRKRKLSLAADDLLSGGEKIIDLAVKYGYDSADSFTRAFVKQHGVTPTAARKPGAVLKIFPAITFQIKIKGAQGMNWRIEERSEFEVFGIERVFVGEEVGKVPDFWAELMQNGEYEKLMVAGGGRAPDGKEKPNLFIGGGVCAVNAIVGVHEPGSGVCPYMLFVIKTADSKTEGYTTAKVPAATWAVFRVDVPDHDDCQIPKLFNRAYSEWLPSSGYEKMTGPDMEIYGGNFEEVWIPVRKTGTK